MLYHATHDIRGLNTASAPRECILTYFQTLTKPTPSLTSHPGGAARVLKSRGYSGPLNDFESKLLSALRGPVVKCVSSHDTGRKLTSPDC